MQGPSHMMSPDVRTRIVSICVIMLTVVASPAAPAQDTSGFVFLPAGRTVAPFRAGVQEPRIGVFKFLDQSGMRVDIGNAVDMFAFTAGSVRCSAGIDFMAYALTTGNQGLRLQIDAIDGFFGGDVSMAAPLGESHTIQARLRILHHSAHMVDGHYDGQSSGWIGNRGPIPYTRDFGELVGAHLFAGPAFTLRSYGGISYATLARPTAIRRVAALAGTELYSDRLAGRIASQPTFLYAAYQMTLAGTPAYAATHQVQIGVKFGEWFGKGPSLYLAYYRGMQMFGEYYDQRLTTVGAGFTVDFY